MQVIIFIIRKMFYNFPQYFPIIEKKCKVSFNKCFLNLCSHFFFHKNVILAKVHTFRLHKCRNTRCSNSRNEGITFLINVDAMMPASPWLGRGKHASTSAHVTKCTLTRTMSTTATYTRYTCHSSSSAP